MKVKDQSVKESRVHSAHSQPARAYRVPQERGLRFAPNESKAANHLKLRSVQVKEWRWNRTVKDEASRIKKWEISLDDIQNLHKGPLRLPYVSNFEIEYEEVVVDGQKSTGYFGAHRG